MDAWLVPVAAVILAAASLLLSTVGVRRQASAEYVQGLRDEIARLSARVEVLERELREAQAERLDALKQRDAQRDEKIALMEQLLRTTGGRRRPPTVP